MLVLKVLSGGQNFTTLMHINEYVPTVLSLKVGKSVNTAHNS